MKTVHVRRAEPVNGRGGWATVIQIVKQVPPVDAVWCREDAEAMFAEDGARLAEALYDSLPGGTFDALLAELLRRRASLFRVGFGGPREDGGES